MRGIEKYPCPFPKKSPSFYPAHVLKDRHRKKLFEPSRLKVVVAILEMIKYISHPLFSP
jgi:hypothetical protein